MWILLKHPANRAVLSGAFAVNPASSRLAAAMVEKLQDAVEVADVAERVNDLGGRLLTASQCGRSALPSAAGAAASATAEEPAAEGAEAGNAAGAGGWGILEERSSGRAEPPPIPEEPAEATATASDGAATVPPVAAEPSGALSARASTVGAASSYAALAAAASTLDDKLAAVEHKRRSVLFQRLTSLRADGTPGDGDDGGGGAASGDAAVAGNAQQPPKAAASQHESDALSSSSGSGARGRAQPPRPSLGGHAVAAAAAVGHRASLAGSVSSAATSRLGRARVDQISGTLVGGAPTATTLDRVRSIDDGVRRSMQSVSMQGERIGANDGCRKVQCT